MTFNSWRISQLLEDRRILAATLAIVSRQRFSPLNCLRLMCLRYAAIGLRMVAAAKIWWK